LYGTGKHRIFGRDASLLYVDVKYTRRDPKITGI
jgi:hypothetical protein